MTPDVIPPATSGPAVPPATTPATTPTTVVLVDDAPEVRALVRTHLRLSGRFTVVGEGADGHDAVALAEAHRPALMLLDVSMPAMDGLGALPLVLATSPGTRVVLLSGFEDDALAARGRELGAIGFIEKSVAPDRLPGTITALLASQAQPTDGTPTGAGPAAGEPTGARPTDEAAGTAPAPEHADGPGGDGLRGDLERFREVFERAAIGMATMTLTGRLVRANQALAGVLERPVGSLVGTDWADLAAGPGADAVHQAARDLHAGTVEVAQVEHDVAGLAPRRVVAATVAVVRGDEGRPLYLFLQAQDVTAQRQADERLRQSEERFRLLVEAVEDYAVFMLDRDGRIASWNTGAERIKGYTAQEVIGEHFRRFYPASRQAERHPEHELEIALREGHYEEEGWRVRKDGSTFWANVVITAVHSGGEHVGFAKVTRDITERRHAGEQQAAAAAALATAKDELEAMNARLIRAAQDQQQFLAVTAHELRTPVTVLGGSADILARHWDRLADDERTEIVEGMATSATRLHRLLGELLTAARLEAGAVTLATAPVPVAEILVAAAAAARTTSGEGDVAGDVVVDADPALTVLADRDRLAQAVDNLIGNALRHGATPVRVTAVADGDRVVVRVRDSGPGVPAAMVARLFDRFATGGRPGGTGLGLFIVRELARAHGGDAWYEPATDGPGAVFALSLPAA